MRMFAAAMLGAAVLGICAAGCATTPGAHKSQTTNADGEHKELFLAKSVEARCKLTLIDAKGNTVAFNGVMTAQGADHLRIQTWRFTRQVVDVCLSPRGLWVSIGSVVRGESREELRSSALDIGKAWAMFAGDRESWGLRLTAMDSTEETIQFMTMPRLDGTQVLTTVESRTHLPVRHELLDADGVAVRSMLLERYKVHDASAWPERMVFESPRGHIVIELSSTKLNATPAADSFVPTQGAEHLR